MRSFDSILESDSVVSKIEGIAINICLKYLSYGQDVCTMMVDRMAPIIIHVLANSYLEADYMCAGLLEVCSSPVYIKEYASDYKAQLLATKPDLIKDNNYVNSLYEKIKAAPNAANRPTFKAVHFSDLHMDYSYIRPDDAPFGNIGDESSYLLLVSMLTYVRDVVQPDFFVWTGDNSKSDTWANTEDEVISYVVNITQTIKELGVDKTIQMFPIEGNHDTFPVNVEDFSHPEMNVPMNAFKPYWQDWLDADQYEIYG